MMIIDGREIADDIKARLRDIVRARKKPPKLFIISVGENPVSLRFLEIKKRFADDIGIIITEKKFLEKTTAGMILQELSSITREDGGIIVQLPLPSDIDKQAVLNAIPKTKDPDVLSDTAISLFKKDTLPILPPVVAAIKEILLRSGIFVGDKKVVIVGRGGLVGVPAAVWFKRHGSAVELLGRDTKDLKSHTIDADIIILGAGSPGILKPDMIKPGVVIIDAGTSEAKGKLRGDADPACAERASVFTPVPGGVGPITVAMLFQNLLTLTEKTP